MNTRLVTRRLLTFALLVVAAATAVAQQREAVTAAGWFDPEHCDICRPMHERPDVMGTMKWDVHKLDAGMLMTSSVAAEKKEAFYAICKAMHAKAPAADSAMCGFCAGFGGLIQAGAKVEELKTDSGMITVITATDPVTVEMIHAVADRSLDEMAKMADLEK